MFLLLTTIQSSVKMFFFMFQKLNWWLHGKKLTFYKIIGTSQFLEQEKRFFNVKKKQHNVFTKFHQVLIS